MPPLTPWYVLSLMREGELLVRYGLEDTADEVFDRLEDVVGKVYREVHEERKRRQFDSEVRREEAERRKDQ